MNVFALHEVEIQNSYWFRYCVIKLYIVLQSTYIVRETLEHHREEVSALKFVEEISQKTQILFKIKTKYQISCSVLSKGYKSLGRVGEWE